MSLSETYALESSLPFAKFEELLPTTWLKELEITKSGIDNWIRNRVDKVLLEIIGFEDISEPLQKIKDE